MSLKTEIEFKDYKKVKPEPDKWYLWAESNWRTKDIQGNPVYHGSIQTLKYTKNGSWIDGYSNSYFSPDYWAEIPKPPKPEPTVLKRWFYKKEGEWNHYVELTDSGGKKETRMVKMVANLTPNPIDLQELEAFVNEEEK